MCPGPIPSQSTVGFLGLDRQHSWRDVTRRVMTRASNGSLSDRELVYPSGNVLEGLRYDLCWHLILTDKFRGLKRTWLIEMFYQHLTGRKTHFYTNVCFANRVGVYIVFLFGFVWFVVLSRRMGCFRKHEMLCVCFGPFWSASGCQHWYYDRNMWT